MDTNKADDLRITMIGEDKNEAIEGGALSRLGRKIIDETRNYVKSTSSESLRLTTRWLGTVSFMFGAHFMIYYKQNILNLTLSDLVSRPSAYAAWRGYVLPPYLVAPMTTLTTTLHFFFPLKQLFWEINVTSICCSTQ